MNDRILVLDSRVIDGFEGLLDLDRAVADALGCQDSDIQAYDVSSLDVSRYIYERILDAYIEYRTENWLSSTAPSMEQIKDSYALMAPRGTKCVCGPASSAGNQIVQAQSNWSHPSLA